MTSKSFYLGDNEDGHVFMMLHGDDMLSIGFQARAASGLFVAITTHLSIPDARRLHAVLGDMLPVEAQPVEAF